MTEVKRTLKICIHRGFVISRNFHVIIIMKNLFPKLGCKNVYYVECIFKHISYQGNNLSVYLFPKNRHRRNCRANLISNQGESVKCIMWRSGT